jgi:cytoskeletal protein CcmA (bactofilin family)
MAIFNQQNPAKKDLPSFASDTPSNSPTREPTPAIADFNPTQSAPPRPTPQPQAPAPAPARDTLKESLIASDLTIEGKIEGAGHIRIAGRFKGDVNVQGDLTIENGARLNGGVRAKKVIVAGDLEGNIDSAQRVELLDSAVLTGDLKAGSLTVAAGAKIRGHIESGWGDGTDAPKGGKDKGAKADLDLAS